MLFPLFKIHVYIQMIKFYVRDLKDFFKIFETMYDDSLYVDILYIDTLYTDTWFVDINI